MSVVPPVAEKVVGPSFQVSDPPVTPVGGLGAARSSFTVVGAVQAEALPSASVAWNSTTVVPWVLTGTDPVLALPAPLVPRR